MSALDGFSVNPMVWDQRLMEIEMYYYNSTAVQKFAQDTFPIVLGISFLYVLLAFTGLYLMKNREKFVLQGPLVAWNICLCLFSIICFRRIFSPVARDWQEGGFHRVVCTIDYVADESGLWTSLWALSKFFEYGDTAFVVLKKKPLIFLHWYHHVFTAFVTWFTVVYPLGVIRVCALINLFVHIIMYGYYAAMAGRWIRFPRWFNMSMTTMQLAQMLAALYINTYAYQQMKAGTGCATTDTHFVLLTVLYGSFAILFGNFFYRTYLAKKEKKEQ